MNVAELKSLASDMGIKVPSKARKADIETLITDAIDTAHAEALEINAQRAPGEATAAIRMRNRVQSYMESNGTDKLTKAQLRRIRKKSNRTGVSPWALYYDYRTVFTS